MIQRENGSMGFGWEQVHGIAEQIEHIKSPDFFSKMDEILNYPKFDPHGSPIPDKNGKMIRKEYHKLSDCKQGDSVKVSAVINTSDEFLNFLNSREIYLGLKMKINFIESFDSTMTVSYNNRSSEMLSQMVCNRLLVEMSW